MRSTLIIAIVCCLALPAAAQDLSPTVLSKDDAHKLAKLAHQKIVAKRAEVALLSREELSAALTTNLSDKTKIIYQDGYGVYIEYTGAHGEDRMWFPGNTDAVIGHWDLRDFGKSQRACFKYFDSKDAVTGEVNNTDCSPAEQTLSDGDTIDARSGDVFGLLSGKIPYKKDSLSVPAWPSASAVGAAAAGK